MSLVFEKLKFWKKKEDELFIDDDLKRPIEGVDEAYHPPEPSVSPGIPPAGAPEISPTMPPTPEPGKDYTVREVRPPLQPSPRNNELILAKLDAIKAIVDNISRRLERIEEVALEEQRKKY